MTELSIAQRLERVHHRVREAARSAGRSPDEVTILAVSKTFPADAIRSAYQAGQRAFGENRVQEGAAKIAELAAEMPGADWHLIGTLQSNKVRAAVEAFTTIESIDSERLAERVSQVALSRGRVMPVLLEVNVAREVSKSGFPPDALLPALSRLLVLPGLELRGLMTVAPLARDPDAVRPVFRALRALRDTAHDRLPLTGFSDLSMGMSNDFRVAIEEGATIVRLGRAIFGNRASAPEI